MYSTLYFVLPDSMYKDRTEINPVGTVSVSASIVISSICYICLILNLALKSASAKAIKSPAISVVRSDLLSQLAIDVFNSV